MKYFFLLFIVFFVSTIGVSQVKVEQTVKSINTSNFDKTQKYSLTPEAMLIVGSVDDIESKNRYYEAQAPHPLHPQFIKHNLIPTYDPVNGKLIAIKGNIKGVKNLKSHEERCYKYLETIKDELHITNPHLEIFSESSTKDPGGRLHTKLNQIYKGIKVLGGEMVIHEEEGDIYMLTGKTVKINTELITTPQINLQEVKKQAIEITPNYKPLDNSLKGLFDHEQVSAELIIYTQNKEQKLAWEVDIFPTLVDRETIIIDAINGDLIERFKTLCKYHDHEKPVVFDGKAQGRGQDLNGNQIDLNIYECTDGFFLVDASRSMFKGVETTCDNSDQLLNGVILTLDARGTSPVNDNFDYNITSSTSNVSWNDPTAISAHINGGRAYEYFLNTFGRQSITGNGTNIVSFVNVADEDGSSMDNAFWNGEFIFYGNGNQAFTSPLAKALDVAGHEMSHGVIQATANLRYQDESGALNEHFADVFGVLIEREDFRIGEDVVNPSVFPTGTLRSMSNPNNGGNRVGDPGYQPAHVSEQFRGSEDNGGVHLNSGIPNFAFYKFVTDERFGTDLDNRAEIGELIWYSALNNYLRSTSNFSDLRVAVLQVASENYTSNVVEALANAFDEVGITGDDITPEVIDLPTNPGEEFVIWSDINLNNIKLSNNQGTEIGILSATSHISRPSATDDGRFVIFVNQSKQIQAVEIDWTGPRVVRDFIVGSETIWRNAVVSKDGSKIAAVTGDLQSGEFESEIIVFDLASETNKSFKLFNPTFSEGTTEVGGVLYADVMEFDFTGEQLIYDAFNQLDGIFGQDLSYWDIGILNVWDNTTSSFDDGDIFKLFSGLPNNISIGNPTFSKNSPNIIAFDLRETDATTDENEFSILGFDRESGAVEEIYKSNTFGFPSYSLDDKNLIFHFLNNESKILAITGLADNKINSEGDAFVFTENADWGIYVGTGARDLTTSTEELIPSAAIRVYPSPLEDELFIEMNHDIKGGTLQVFDLTGKSRLVVDMYDKIKIDLSTLEPGPYIIAFKNGEVFWNKKIIKL